MNKMDFYLADIKETKLFAAKLAKLVSYGDILTFSGELGAGKTHFIQFLIEAISGGNIEVTSPTFNLLHIYQIDNSKIKEIYHFDLYRLKHFEEIYELGIEHAFEQALTLIEWPEMIKSILPKDRLEIKLSFQDIKEEVRLITLQSFGRWNKIITENILKED